MGIRNILPKTTKRSSITFEMFFDAIMLLKDGWEKYLLPVIHYITGREKAKNAQGKSGELYRDLFNNANIAIFQTTPEGRFLKVNPKFAHVFGFSSPEEVITAVDNAANLFTNPERREEIIRLKTENPELTTFENEYRRKDGGTFTGKLNVRRVVDSKNRQLFFEGFIEDITERKHAEEALAESELKYRTLFNSMGQGFYLSQIIYDKDGFPCDYMYIDVNPAFEQIIGLKKEQIIGKTYKELAPPDPDPGRFACFKRVAMTGMPENYIYLSKRYSRYFEVYAFRPEEGKFCALVKDITKSKRMEEKLKKTLERLDLASKSAGLGIWDWDIEKNELVWDDRMYEIFGIKREEFTGAYEALLACVHPDDLDHGKEISMQALRGEREYDTEFRVIWPDGTIHYIKTHGTVERNSEGKAVRMTGVNYDITERKHAEEAVKESGDRFRKIFEEAHIGIVITLPSFIFEKANPAFCRMMGYSEDELRSMNFAGITHHDHLAQDMENVKKVERGEIPFYQTEKRYIHKSGKVIWGNLIVSSIRDGHNTLRYYLSMINDITERKQAEEALRASEMRWRLSIENMLEAYSLHEAIFDANGRMTDYRFLEFNPAAQKITNIARGDVVGKTALELYPHIVERGLMDRYADVMATGIPAYIEDFYYAGDKLNRAFDISCFRLDNRHFVSMFRDITERKRAEEEHLKYEQQLLQNQRLESLGIFAGGIAHDFNNLLGIIYGNLQLISMDPEGKGTAEYAASCLKTMDRARGITAQLLTFSKGGAPVKKTGNLVPFIRSSVKFALSGSNCIPDFNIEEGLWTLDYDENQIGQVFDNIIINATQAMPNGGKLEVSAKNIILQSGQNTGLRAGDYVRISFKDNGIGMHQDILVHIFDPYFTTKKTGRGLGLASAYSIVKNHSGCIDVDSLPGKGTVFHIYLPASKKPLSGGSARPVSVLKKTGKILIMDDEPDLLKVLVKMLKSAGCKTVGAIDGEEVINLLLSPKHKKAPFMAIILDLTIPGGMGGIETVKEIRKFAPDLPVFVYSGYSNNDAMADPEKYGFTGSLKKPLEREELIGLMNKYIA